MATTGLACGQIEAVSFDGRSAKIAVDFFVMQVRET